MAKGDSRELAQSIDARDGDNPARGCHRRSGTAGRKEGGRSADPSDAASEASAAAGSRGKRGTPKQAPRTSLVRATPGKTHSLASAELSNGKEARSQSRMATQQSRRHRGRTREAVATGPEATLHTEGQQSEARQVLSRGQRKKEKERRRKARNQAWENGQGQQGVPAVPNGNLTSNKAGESSAGCSVCWGECNHRDGSCECLECLPEDLLAMVKICSEESQRHYALTLIQRFWERNKPWPAGIPTISRVRGRVFCYSCDSCDHFTEECPDLDGMDEDTFSCLLAAYTHGSCNGKHPDEIYADWEHGADPPEMLPCISCRSTEHCFEACRNRRKLPEEDFSCIKSALMAGQVKSAQQCWDAILARKEQSVAPKKTVHVMETAPQAVLGGRSHAPAGSTDSKIPGGNVGHGSQPGRPAPRGVRAKQEAPQEDYPSPAITSLEGSCCTSLSTEASPWPQDPSSKSKPYWHEALAARAAMQAAPRSMPPVASQIATSGAPTPGASEPGQAGAADQGPQTAAQHSQKSLSLQEIEAGPQTVALFMNGKSLPPLPQQPGSALSTQADQVQRSLASRTVLVTPLAPSARASRASAPPSRPDSTAQQSSLEHPSSAAQHDNLGQHSAFGQPTRPVAAVQKGGPRQPGASRQPSRTASAAQQSTFDQYSVSAQFGCSVAVVQKGDSGPPGAPGQHGHTSSVARGDRLGQPVRAAIAGSNPQQGKAEGPAALGRYMHPDSGAQEGQEPPVLSSQHLAISQTLHLDAQKSAVQDQTAQHALQSGQEPSSQQEILAPGKGWGGQQIAAQSMPGQHTAATFIAAERHAGLQDKPVHREHALQSTSTQHPPHPPGTAQHLLQQHRASATPQHAPAAARRAPYADQSVALGIPAERIPSAHSTGSSPYMPSFSGPLLSVWMPHAPGPPHQMSQQMSWQKQHSAFEGEMHHLTALQQHHMPQSAPFSHLSGIPVPMQSAQVSADFLAQQHQANGSDSRQQSAFSNQQQQHHMPQRATLSHPGDLPALMQSPQLLSNGSAHPLPESSIESWQQGTPRNSQQQQQQQQYHLPQPASLSQLSGVPGPMHSGQLLGNGAAELVPTNTLESWQQGSVRDQQQHHHMLHPAPLSGPSSMPATPMQSGLSQPSTASSFESRQQGAVRDQEQQRHILHPAPSNPLCMLPDSGTSQPIPASTMETRQQSQHANGRIEEAGSKEVGRIRTPPGFAPASEEAPRPMHDLIAPLQVPERQKQQPPSQVLQAPLWDQKQSIETSVSQQSVSHPQGGHIPWLPNAAAAKRHVSAPDSTFPAPEPLQRHRPQPRKDPQREQQDPQPVSCSQQLPEQMPPVQQPDFAEAMTAQWEMHSSSVAPSPGPPQYKPRPAGADVASERPASVSSVASAASTPPRQPIDDIMALLLHGMQPAEIPGAEQSAQGAEREVSSPRQSDCPASPGLSEGPRRSLSSSPEPEVLAAKGVWGKPLPEAVKAAPRSTIPLTSPAPLARPSPGPSPVQTRAQAKPQSAPTTKEAPVACPEKATSWTQGVKHSKGAAPDEDRKQDAPASPSSADNADEENLKAAIKENLKMQAAGKSWQAAKDASAAAPDQAAGSGLQNNPGEHCCFVNGILQSPCPTAAVLMLQESLKMQAAGKSRPAAEEASRAESAPDQAAGPGLQNDPGEYNCFLNVIVQCLWHCAAFRDAFLNLPCKVLQADQVLSELHGLFKAFGKIPEGSTGKKTLDPTGLRLALANLDPKRFAAGEMSDAAEVLNVVTDRLDKSPEGKAMAESVFGCHIREQRHCKGCGSDTRQKTYCQYLYTASAAGLREQALMVEIGDDGRTLPVEASLVDIGEEGKALPVEGSAVIRKLERHTTIKSCNRDEGGCGRTGPMQQFLEGCQPRAFALQLVWESLQEAGQDIKHTIDLIYEGIDLGKVYLGTGADKRRYWPSIMVCYYGRHYHAFVRMDGQWQGFDDAASYAVGSWAELVRKCELGKIQPSVLFFEPV